MAVNVKGQLAVCFFSFTLYPVPDTLYPGPWV